MLTVDRIRKHYPRKDRAPGEPIRALDDVSLTLAPGDFTALVGPSGSGKTTLLLTAAGMLAPDSGAVHLDGKSLYQLSPQQRAALRATHIGFVFQQFHLVPYLTVLDNVLVPTLAVPAKDARPYAEQLLEQFGLAARRDHVPAELSTGERQRVALARALLNRPKVLLADEPTGNLDADNAAILLAHLKNFAAQGGAVLLVTHDANAAACAARTLRLRSGALA